MCHRIGVLQSAAFYPAVIVPDVPDTGSREFLVTPFHFYFHALQHHHRIMRCGDNLFVHFRRSRKEVVPQELVLRKFNLLGIDEYQFQFRGMHPIQKADNDGINSDTLP